MFKKMTTKKIAAGIVSLSISGLFLASALVALPAMVSADAPDPGDSDFGLSDTGFQQVGVRSDNDLKDTIAQIINIILGFLGIIAVIIILAGGFKWMTAGGNEDKVAESRKMIVQGVIGLVVIFAAWAIASFVIDQLRDVQGI